jgi:P4 family phage/plasmid primase-like protien
MSDPDVDEFVEFLSLLTDNAPEDYTPWLFRVEAGSKAPALEYGSWKEEQARLTRHEAIEWMQSGGNVGIAGRPDDALINVDIDDEDATTIDDLKPTLIARSRSRTGVHAWYFEAPGGDIPNIPTDDAGEVRANWQYVVAPGSYVETDPDGVPDDERDRAGYYTVERTDSTTSIRLDELPEVFREHNNPDPDAQRVEVPDSDEFEQSNSGSEQSGVFDISARDVVRKEGGSTNPGDRWSALFHGSDTGENMSVSSQGHLHCWRHEVTHNGLQALCVLSDYRGDCQDVGTGHKHSGAGSSCLHAEDGAHIWHAWKYAKRNGYIPDDDPVPYSALKHVCRERDFCPISEIPAEYDPDSEDGRLPEYAYNAAIESIEGHDDLNPGRSRTEDFGEDYEGTPSVDELLEDVETDDSGDEQASETGSESDEADGPVDPEPPDSDDRTPDSDDSDAATEQDWQQIYQAYIAASDGDEKLGPRYEASKLLMEESHWRTIEENDSLWQYDPDTGIYRENGEEALRTRLDEQLREQFVGQEQREIERKLRARTVVQQDDMGGPDHLVCCHNGVLQVYPDSVELQPHAPEHNFLGRIQTDYDPAAECPRFREFLDESVDSGTDKKKLQEYAGYCLMHWALPHHKALFLVGPTASGKSTFLDTIRTMLGDDAVSSLTPQQMVSEQFGGAELYGSWANIRNDIPNELIDNVGQFKEISAGDPIKAEQKYEDPFMFEPKAKHMFSANELPSASTDDRAFYRRILLVAFPNETPRDERDTHLDDKLQAEHPGILNWALNGLQRLMQQGGFTGDREPWQTEETWEKWSESAKRFDNICLQDGGSSLATSDIWEAYLAFCDEQGIPSKSRPGQLTKALKGQGYTNGREYIDGEQRRVLYDVEFTEAGQQYFDGTHEDNGGDVTGLSGY